MRNPHPVDLDTLSRILHQRFSPDAAQDALVALLARPAPPDDPVAYCHRVAKRREALTGYWRPRKVPVTLVHVDVDVTLRDALVGSQEPEQERRLEARECLTALPDATLLLGAGYLDTHEPAPPKRQDQARRTWAQRQRRKRARG